MKHLRWIPSGEWPRVPVRDDDPDAGKRDATERELREMDLVVVGEHPDGGWIVECLGRSEGEEIDCNAPGHRLSEGRGRYKRIPARARKAAWAQRVIREPGLRSNLRQSVGRAAEPDGPPVSPVGRGREPAVEHREPDPSDVLDAARARAEDPDTPARRMHVPVADVREDDVVEDRPQPGHRWSGEPERGERDPMSGRPRPLRGGTGRRGQQS
jgi:hypothetical protein